MIEIWKDVPGYEGTYQVSDRGRVQSLDRYVSKLNRWGGYSDHFKEGTILSSQINNSGYLIVHLYLEGRRKIQLVHRLVALAFLDNPSNHPEVNHKNSGRLINHLTNLEWISRLENVAHSRTQGNFKPEERGFPVIGTPLKGGEELSFRNQGQAEIFFRGKYTSAVYYNLIGRCKSAYGYKWRRA